MRIRPIEKKLNILLLLVALIFVVLWTRLAYLQIWQTEKFNLASQSNRIRLITVSAARGEIKDRHGIVVAKNKPSYTVSLALLDLKTADQEAVFAKLASILKMPIQDIRNAVKAQPLKYEPVQIMTDVPVDIVTKIEEQRMSLPGVIIEIQPLREYPYGDFLAHVLGYTRQTGDEKYIKKMMEKYPEEQYKKGDHFGMAGLERWFESDLHGLDGARQVEVDRRMRPVRDLGIKEPIPGNDLIMTIDSNLQRVAEQSLDRTMLKVQKSFPNAKAGAIVVLDVRNGEVLALASKPSYDPNRFNRPIPVNEWNQKFSDKLPYPPLINRVLSPYAPGSTFKMVTGSAALESKRWNSNITVYDPGYYQLGPRKFKCWQTSGHGRVDLRRALQVSCNTYFFTAGIAAGNVEIARIANEFGLGKKTDITLPGESTGNVPTAAWKKETNTKLLEWRYRTIYSEINKKYAKKIAKAGPAEKTRLEKEKARAIRREEQNFKGEMAWNTAWQAFDTLNMSIGQGANNYTPIQLANYIAIIANGGTGYKPTLVKKIVSSTGKVIEEFKPEILHKANISAATLQHIREGMRAVAQPGGTAAGLFVNFPVKVAAKTGTAQVLGKDNNGVFVGFAPYDKPEIAVVAIMEQGGHGGSSAGIVASEVMAAYFKVNPNKAGQYSSVEE